MAARVDKHDRRQTMVRLTRGDGGTGRDQTETERHVSRTLAPLTPAERAQLMTTLKVLARVLGSPGDLSCPPESPST
jgi:hypothetical protein